LTEDGRVERCGTRFVRLLGGKNNFNFRMASNSHDPRNLPSPFLSLSRRVSAQGRTPERTALRSGRTRRKLSRKERERREVVYRDCKVTSEGQTDE